MTHTDKIDRKKKAVLQVLQVEKRPLSSTEIVQMLHTADMDLSERAVRIYLQQLDDEGLTKSMGRQGRVLTPLGEQRLYDLQVLQRVGYLSAKIDQMVYRMSFDLASRTGKLISNVSLVDPHILADNIHEVCSVFERNYSMGNLVYLLGPGESVGSTVVPFDKIGFCTVCTITLNGVLLKHGIPMNSRFAGLLQYENYQPMRFTEIMHYNGTSIDPLEMFIRAGMTDFTGAIRSGTGLVGAGFREIPLESRAEVAEIDKQLREAGLGAFVIIGHPNQTLLGIPVSEGRIGAITMGGLNPIGILEEKGHRVFSRALSGLMEYPKLFHYTDLPRRILEFL